LSPSGAAYPIRAGNTPVAAGLGGSFGARGVGDVERVTLLGWLWLASPFAVIAVISHHPPLQAQVAAHHRRCMVAGWGGAAMMVLGITLIPDPLGTAMFWVGTPLAGLAVWLRRDDDDGGEGDDEPDVPPVDWDEFERSFWAHVRRRGRSPRRPRSPTAR
jgi:hypothetical protein